MSSRSDRQLIDDLKQINKLRSLILSKDSLSISSGSSDSVVSCASSVYFDVEAGAGTSNALAPQPPPPHQPRPQPPRPHPPTTSQMTTWIRTFSIVFFILAAFGAIYFLNAASSSTTTTTISSITSAAAKPTATSRITTITTTVKTEEIWNPMTN